MGKGLFLRRGRICRMRLSRSREKLEYSAQARGRRQENDHLLRGMYEPPQRNDSHQSPFGPPLRTEGHAGWEREVSRAPITYINRLRLKNRFRNAIQTEVARERTFTTGEEKKRGGMKRLLVRYPVPVSCHYYGLRRDRQEPALHIRLFW